MFTGVRRTIAVVPRALEAVLVLPRLSSLLEEVARNTSDLPTISEQLAQVAHNTDALAAVSHHTDRLVENTTVLPETHAELIAMRAAIVEMRANTSTMATDLSDLATLEQTVPPLVPLLADVDETVRRLAEVVEPLSGATARVGRFAGRLPSRGAPSNGR